MTGDSRIYVFATVKAKSGREDQLREALLRLVKVVQKEAGMIRYDLHEHHSESGCFSFYEIWEDQASLDAHGATEDMRAHSELTSGWVETLSVEIFSKIA